MALDLFQFPPSLFGSSHDTLTFPNIGKKKQPSFHARMKMPEALQFPGGETKRTHTKKSHFKYMQNSWTRDYRHLIRKKKKKTEKLSLFG